MARPAVEQPSTDRFFELACSPAVKIYVGPEEKEYTLPKDLLCYYSPYFVACFNGGFKETKEGVLRLSEDEPRYFDVLTAYLRNGTATFWGHDLPDCIAFITFCDKYDIGEMAATTGNCLQSLLRTHPALYIEPGDMSTFAALLHPQNPALRVMYRSYIERLGKKGASTGAGIVRDLIANDDRVALGIMRELRLKVEQVKHGGQRTIFELSSGPVY